MLLGWFGENLPAGAFTTIVAAILLITRALERLFPWADLSLSEDSSEVWRPRDDDYAVPGRNWDLGQSRPEDTAS